MPYDQLSDDDAGPGDGGGSTPYRARKTAAQTVQFSLDPDYPVSKKRWFFASNGTDFDRTNVTGSTGEVELATTATGSDTARLRSAISGEYVSHALAEPGQAVRIPSAYLQYDTEGAVQLSHGRMVWGTFTYDSATGSIENGLGLVLDSTGLSAFLRKDAAHVGKSPVPQNKWNQDPALDPGRGTGVLDLSAGLTWNEPYTWYNANPLAVPSLSTMNWMGRFGVPIVGDVFGLNVWTGRKRSRRLSTKPTASGLALYHV